MDPSAAELDTDDRLDVENHEGVDEEHDAEDKASQPTVSREDLPPAPTRPPVPLHDMLQRAVQLQLIHANTLTDFIARSSAAGIPMPMIPPVQDTPSTGMMIVWNPSIRTYVTSLYPVNDTEPFTPLIRLNVNHNRATFGDFKLLAFALKRLAMLSGFEIRVKYSSKRNKRWECRVRECPFLLSGYRNKDNKVHVTDIELMHNHALSHPLYPSAPADGATDDDGVPKSSEKVARNTTLSIELVLASMFDSETGQDVMTKDPEEMRLKYIQSMLLQQYGATISTSMASRAKKKFVDMFYEPSSASYQLLRPYFEKCVAANPGSFYLIDHIPTVTPTGAFEYGRCLLGVGPAFRMLPDAAPVIVLEAAPMNSDMNKIGYLLVASTRDYNNEPIYLALAHVPATDDVNWAWFLQHLKDNNIPISKHTTFLTDGSMGTTVTQALLQVFPYQPHRYAILQLLQMVCQMSGQARLTPEEEHLVLQMASSLNMDRYMESFSLLWSLNKDLCRCLEGIPKEHWVVAAMIERGWPTLRDISLRHCVGDFAKSTLGSLMCSCNLVPCFYLLLLSLHRASVARFNAIALHSDLVLLPYQQSVLNQRLSESARFEIVECRPQEVYFAHVLSNVHHKAYKIVNVRDNSCTCGDWQQFHLPCTHGLAVFAALGRNVWELITRTNKSKPGPRPKKRKEISNNPPPEGVIV
ncbi:hypothetical protein B5M09_000876 [Aphanomyces astaci]|uniref:SWIM-type domain-containing protein n=2 Tax=Aphanomyces astaci TaxID=112090 RepID=A0A3R7WP54_APHAT|nr:hypothetical protein B5M09_000876 [Aphanomyces astaci]